MDTLGWGLVFFGSSLKEAHEFLDSRVYLKEALRTDILENPSTTGLAFSGVIGMAQAWCEGSK